MALKSLKTSLTKFFCDISGIHSDKLTKSESIVIEDETLKSPL